MLFKIRKIQKFVACPKKKFTQTMLTTCSKCPLYNGKEEGYVRCGFGFKEELDE